jgi:hypothetical protein
VVDFSKYDRSNTVAGLVAKHAELTGLRERYSDEIKNLTVDIDHLDAAIRLFDPEADTSPMKEYVTKHKAEKGSSSVSSLACSGKRKRCLSRE